MRVKRLTMGSMAYSRPCLPYLFLPSTISCGLYSARMMKATSPSSTWWLRVKKSSPPWTVGSGILTCGTMRPTACGTLR